VRGALHLDRFESSFAGDEGAMSEHEDRPEEPAEEPDAGWQVGDPPEEGREGDEQDSGFQERGGQGG
jgi:hypothetical protein